MFRFLYTAVIWALLSLPVSAALLNTQTLHVDSRTALEAINTGNVSSGDPAYVEGSDQWYQWSTANHAADITAQGAQSGANYVAPDSDPDGSSGAWVQVTPKQFRNKATAEAWNPAVEPFHIQLGGYLSDGDGGGGLYFATATEPAHEGKFQIASGQWYELVVNDSINPLQFGARCTGDEAQADEDTAGYQAAIDYMFEQREVVRTLDGRGKVCFINQPLTWPGDNMILKTFKNMWLNCASDFADGGVVDDDGLSYMFHFEDKVDITTTNFYDNNLQARADNNPSYCDGLILMDATGINQIKLSRNMIRNFSGTGLRFSDVGPGQEIMLHDNHINGITNPRTATCVRMNGADSAFHDNVIHGCEFSVILENSGAADFVGNHIYGDANQFIVRDSRSFYMDDNYIDNTEMYFQNDNAQANNRLENIKIEGNKFLLSAAADQDVAFIIFKPYDVDTLVENVIISDNSFTSNGAFGVLGNAFAVDTTEGTIDTANSRVTIIGNTYDDIREVSGGTGTAITWMTELGIRDRRLTIFSAGGAGTVAPSTTSDDFVVENAGNVGISILSPDANTSQIYFGSPADEFSGFIQWDLGNDLLTLGSHNTGADTRLTAGVNVEVMRALDTGLVTFGGVTSSSPGLKPSGTVLEHRLADDSAYSGTAASRFVHGIRHAITVDAATTFALTTSDYITLACTGAETINTITGGVSGVLLIVEHTDTECTIADDDSATAANAVDLTGATANDIGAVAKVITLLNNGTHWLQVSESDN